MKHTKGKWIVKGNLKNEVTYIMRDDKYIATIHSLADGISNEELLVEAEANAKLIVAAPELLKALERAKYLVEKGRFKILENNFFEEEIKFIKNTIKKAEGNN